MGDRELLVLAAKAAGIRLFVYGATGYEGYQDQDAQKPWNPLIDDGDALRLAVKLNIHISLYGPNTGMNAWIIREIAESFDEDYGDDPCASARRAIVRAAAHIGLTL